MYVKCYCFSIFVEIDSVYNMLPTSVHKTTRQIGA
jgi:hypothetical protein